MKRLLLAVTCLAMTAAAAAAARGADDPLDPPTIGGVVVQNLHDAVSAFGEAQQHRAALEAEIQQARARYWQTYGGAGADEAAAEFGRVLLAKDLVYLTIYVSQGIPRGEGGKITRLIERAISVDGGIRYGAVPAFADLVTALRKDLGARGDEDQVFIGALGPALVKRQDRFIAYVRARDWAEVEASGVDLSKILTPRAYVLGLFEGAMAQEEYANPDVPRPDPREQGSALYTRIVKAVGEEPMLKAAAALLAAARSPDGRVVPPGKEGQPPVPALLCFGDLLAAESPKAYALIVLQGPQIGGDSLASAWNGGFAVYERLVKEHGAARVANVAAAVQKAPKHFEMGTKVADFSGNEMHDEGWWIKSLLADAKPKSMLGMFAGSGKRLTLPTVTQPPVHEATDLEAVLKYANTGVSIKLRGVVGDRWKEPPDQVPQYMWVALQGVDQKRLMLRCRAEYEGMFNSMFPAGTNVEVTSSVDPAFTTIQGNVPAALNVDFLGGRPNIARYDPAAAAPPTPAPAADVAGGR